MQRGHGNAAVARALLQRQGRPKPDYLVSHTFCGKGVGNGINPLMKKRLEDVEAHLKTVFDALSPELKTNRLTGRDGVSR